MNNVLDTETVCDSSNYVCDGEVCKEIKESVNVQLDTMIRFHKHIASLRIEDTDFKLASAALKLYAESCEKFQNVYKKWADNLGHDSGTSSSDRYKGRLYCLRMIRDLAKLCINLTNDDPVYIGCKNIALSIGQDLIEPEGLFLLFLEEQRACGYIKEFVENTARFKTATWCRRAGKTITAARIIGESCYNRCDWTVVSPTKEQSITAFGIMKPYLLAAYIKCVIENGGELDANYFTNKDKVAKSSIVFPNNAEVWVGSSVPDRARGGRHSCYVDEAAFFEDDAFEALMRALLPIILDKLNKESNLILTSSPAGIKENCFYELKEAYKLSDSWFHSRCDVYRAIGDGRIYDIEELKKEVKQYIFEAEYECSDDVQIAMGDFFSWQDIEKTVTEEELEKNRHSLKIMGFDWAQTGDLAAYWIIAKSDDGSCVSYDCGILPKGLTCAEQAAALKQIIWDQKDGQKHSGLFRLVADRGAGGKSVYEELQREFPANIVEVVSANSSPVMISSNLQQARHWLQEGKLKFINKGNKNSDLARRSFLAIRFHDKTHRVIMPRRNDIGHCDLVAALAFCLQGIDMPARRPNV